jgi:hypothetical protein
VQSERVEQAFGSEVEVVAGAVMLASMSSVGFQANNTEKWFEVVDGVSAKGKEKEIVVADGGKLVCLEGWGQTVLSQRLDNLGPYQNRP